MDDKSLQRKILDMRAELTNLKTAHPHGLGSFEYFTGSAQCTTTATAQDWTATVSFVDNSLFPPLIQASIKRNGSPTPYGWQIKVQNDNTIKILFFGLYSGETYDVEVVSTAQIRNIVMTQE